MIRHNMYAADPMHLANFPCAHGHFLLKQDRFQQKVAAQVRHFISFHFAVYLPYSIPQHFAAQPTITQPIPFTMVLVFLSPGEHL